ncbi:MAG: hypothetical protein H6742_07865 [Alphaproteobacteria bacterium]|nr:hypothetical protein [Alphaproteobacteria bacterium]
MSFIKRLGNLGKGMWKVQTSASDPGQAERIAALQEELARTQARSGDSAASLLVGGRSTARTAPTGGDGGDDAGMQRQLDALAESLRRGDIDRAAYDQRSEQIIARHTGEPAAASPDPAPSRATSAPDPEPPGDEDRPFGDEGGVKRTL